MLKKEALALLIALILVPVVSAAPFQIYGELTPALPNKLKLRLAVNGTDVYNGVIKDGKFGYETPIMIEMGNRTGQRISIYISDVKVDEFQPQGSIVKRYIPISAALYEQITGKKLTTGTATQGGSVGSLFSSIFSSAWFKYMLFGIAGLVLLAGIVFLIYKISKMPRKEKEPAIEEEHLEEEKVEEKKPEKKLAQEDKSDPMVQLKSYVQRRAEAGKTKDEIKQKLKSVGWPEHVIDEVLEHL